jgi:metallo-beta-lactamase family protein
MQVTCLGAARTVTGSCFLLETEDTRFLVDCGMFQGGKEIEKRNYLRKEDVSFRDIPYILLTHAHMDHSGLIPRAVKEGFKGKILCTEATFELCRIMLRDSAHIQEMETEWINRKNKRSGGDLVEPLYTSEDAERSLSFFKSMDFDECFSIRPDVEICFRKAGHILGASFLDIRFREKNYQGKLVFSGDIGRKEALIVPDPEIIEMADFLFVESTYGDRGHKTLEDSKKELLAAVQEGLQNKEKIIIPAFAIERTQEILFILHGLLKEGLIPSIPVYVDSPLAIAATEIFKRYPEYFDEDLTRSLAQGEDPFNLPQLKFCRTAEESMAINRQPGTAIIIAASGMCNAGRIKHHLKHNLWRVGAQIVITGFQAQGTLGRALVEGAKKVRIFQEDVVVRAKIHTIGGFSAHADQKELLSWLGHFKNPDLQVFVVHGEESSSLAFARAIQENFSFQVEVPHFQEVLSLSPPQAKTPLSQEDLQALWEAVDNRWQVLKGALQGESALRGSQAEEIKAFLENTEKKLKNLT